MRSDGKQNLCAICESFRIKVELPSAAGHESSPWPSVYLIHKEQGIGGTGDHGRWFAGLLYSLRIEKFVFDYLIRFVTPLAVKGGRYPGRDFFRLRSVLGYPCPP